MPAETAVKLGCKGINQQLGIIKEMSPRNIKASLCPQSIMLANTYTGDEAIKNIGVARR